MGTPNLLALLETDILRTFVSVFKDVFRQPRSYPLYGIELEFVKSLFVLGGLFPEPKRGDFDIRRIVEPYTYIKWLHWTSGTIQIGARKTL